MNILVIGSGVMAQHLRDEIINSGNHFVGFCENDFSNFDEKIDVIIDFSHPSLTKKICEFAVNKKLPLLVATTGQSENEINQFTQASKHIPILISHNTSYGVYVMKELVGLASKLLDDYDVEIIEAHHNRKIDAPSGTLNLLLDKINENRKLTPVYDRHKKHEKRSNAEIGVHSIRAGNIFGEHTVIFAKDDEIIKIEHSALSRKIFAKGAIKIAEKLINMPNGLYRGDL